MSLEVNSRVISQIIDLKTSVPGVTRKESRKKEIRGTKKRQKSRTGAD